MRPRHYTAENQDSVKLRNLKANRPGLRALGPRHVNRLDHRREFFSTLLKNCRRNRRLARFERCRDPVHHRSARFTAADGARAGPPVFLAPAPQTMIGSRATASKRLPKLSTRGDTLSAGPRSTIRT